MTINTSGPICSVAIISENQTMYYEESTSDNQHSESLFQLIHTLFDKSNNSYNTITNLGVVVGPGSFTGIRVGIAAAQGIHLASKITLHGISTLEMQAYLIYNSTKINDGEILSIIEMSNNKFYSQTFNNQLIATNKIKLLDKNFNYHDFTHHIQSITSKNFNARVAALILAYKLQNNLPTLNSTPIYFNTIN
ncbi:tRNA threonylcarbamoyl adenosine modification protein YeaZ [Ehrlichia chaffeensis str. Heartland]|nr:tRNA threonylcarbamoyl adenosine modification protein YeaZ [Ehrlichia chaffeensis str. Heartland]AHX05476.1 tRNA threonylcarbamoyl adenosine modification protein YeaZ [Ehrlichia chaffeensis str. Jax]AHX06464.1 tRNA threonylcarbamoyl adenosine modification protein YeaZ [Ehrlichia chaffeensis str. Liberty]AHX08842.1 tRNA threonylcarbamoyl adenosine modification protein YeaZ [Ehrlichia chaffeensis str. Saint Vincent]AHX10340.1 tRNA threonylcarbamoyl adenosine modification protein YeaZ [Ehrlichi